MTIFGLEVKKRLTLKYLILFVFSFVVLTLFIHNGKIKYLNHIDNIKPFQNKEIEKVNQFVLYRQYAAFGVNYLCIPSPYSILFSDYAFNGLESSFNVGERLSIHNSVKGRVFFHERSGYTRFSGFLLILLVLLWMGAGFEAAIEIEYKKALTSITGSSPQKVITVILLSRLLIMTAFTLAVIIFPTLTLLPSNINLFGQPLLIIIIVSILLGVSVFSIGGLIGYLNKSLRAIVFGAVYFSFIMLIPFFTGLASEINASGIESTQKFDHKSLSIILKLDKRLIEKFGSLKTGETPSKETIMAIKEALKKEHKALWKREIDRKNEIDKKIKQQQTWANLFPPLYYLSVNRELSGQGGLSLVDFYDFTEKGKENFTVWYVDKRFFSEQPPDKIGKVENFIKGDENLFYSKSRLPHHFSTGLIVTVVYALVFLCLFIIVSSKASKIKLVKEEIPIKKDQNPSFILCRNEELKASLFETYRLKGYVCLDGLEGFRSELSAGVMLNYFSRLARLTEEQKQKAAEYLQMLASDGNEQKRKELSEEDVLRIYAAVKLASADNGKEQMQSTQSTIVLNDFFKEKSRGFEVEIIPLFEKISETGQRLIYLSCDQPYPAVRDPLSTKEKKNDFKSLPLNFSSVTMR